MISTLKKNHIVILFILSIVLAPAVSWGTCKNNKNCLTPKEVASAWLKSAKSHTHIKDQKLLDNLCSHAVAIAMHESCYPNIKTRDCDPRFNHGKCCNPHATSSSEAIGLWQTTCLPRMNDKDKTKRFCSVKARRDPVMSAKAASWILRCACPTTTYPDCSGRRFCRQWSSYPWAIREYERTGIKACRAARQHKAAPKKTLHRHVSSPAHEKQNILSRFMNWLFSATQANK